MFPYKAQQQAHIPERIADGIIASQPYRKTRNFALGTMRVAAHTAALAPSQSRQLIQHILRNTDVIPSVEKGYGNNYRSVHHFWCRKQAAVCLGVAPYFVKAVP